MIASRYRIACFRVALLATAALVAHLATTDQSYPVVEHFYDKASHVLAFGALSLLADFSFPAIRFGLAKVLPLLAYGALIEVVQYYLPHREASLYDLFADGVGIAAYAMGVPLLDRVPLLRRIASLRRVP